MEAKTPLEKSYFWPRVLRPAIRKDKHIIMDLCTENGMERRIIAKSHGLQGGYRLAKKVKWGDLWYFPKRVPNKYRKEGKFGKRLW
jgi:ribosomal protein RSM22 (predicted rRNA methylase)